MGVSETGASGLRSSVFIILNRCYLQLEISGFGMGVLTRSCFFLFFFVARGRTLRAEEREDHRDKEQGGKGRDQKSANDRASKRCVLFAAFAQAERHRQHPNNHRAG